jgi:hypothetical protein
MGHEQEALAGEDDATRSAHVPASPDAHGLVGLVGPRARALQTMPSSIEVISQMHPHRASRGEQVI